jgi:hypothetical protein
MSENRFDVGGFLEGLGRPGGEGQEYAARQGTGKRTESHR